MKRKVLVISLGGSLIVPEKINVKFLQNFRKTIKKHTKKYKFVIVTGGGTIARKYINALATDNCNIYLQNLAGISVTRLNARFMSYIFGKDPHWGIPNNMKQVKNLLRTNDVVFCGALRYAPNQTSDSTAAKLANYLDAEFINLTNVKGLYNINPMKYKNARFIPQITREELYNMIIKIEYKPGQHAPLDQTAITIIKNNKIKSYILGSNLKNLNNLLNNKKFVGTIVD